MKVHLSPSTMDFLKQLKKNNNRDWFLAHKPDYQQAKDEFLALVTAVIEGVSKFDPQIKDLDPSRCLLRINRDVRFSKDKSPYKTAFTAHLLAGGRKQEKGRAGYYINCSPGNGFLAGGAYTPPGPWMSEIRERIEQEGDVLRGILKKTTFKKYFGTIEGEQLKTAPRGYDVDHPQIDLLRYKSFLAVHRFEDDQVSKAGFSQYVTQVFKALYPFDCFLNGEAV